MSGKYPKTIRARQPVRIDTGDANPTTAGYRRLNEEEQRIVKEYVEKLIAADVVEPCSGPWSSPILLVPKKDGGLRAVADLRKVNECVQRDSYPMPDIQESLDQLSGATWFTTLDLSSAFWQLPLAEDSRDCTAFMTKDGLFRWKASPMGFKNSSAYFQREIDLALGGLRFSCCIAYIHDICIYSNGTFEDHLLKVRNVMKALKLVGFSGNPTKCLFAQKQVTFLGHKIAAGKMHPLHDKIKCMLEYEKPKTLTELRAFLGLMSYYRRYIKNFSHLAAPLTELTGQTRSGKSKKAIKLEANAPWPDGLWGREQDEAFEVLKGALITRPVLSLPVANRKWRLATDASKLAMWAVLSQIDEDVEEHPVADRCSLSCFE